MNRRSLLAALALAFTVSAPAFADAGAVHAGTYGDTSWYGKSTKTRAEVRAELVQAQQGGMLANGRKSSSSAPGLGMMPRMHRATP